MASTMASSCRAGAARAALAGLTLLLAWSSSLAPLARAAAEPGAAATRPADAGSAQTTADPAGPEAAPGATAAGAAAPSGTSDPVIGEVLRMLRGGVASPVVVLWLDKSGKRPAAVGSGDLVALHEAGASDELLKKLIQLAGATAPAAAAPSTAAPAGSARQAKTRAAAPASAAGAAPASASGAAPASAASASGPPAAAPPPAASTAASAPGQASGTTGGADVSSPPATAMPTQTPGTAAAPVAGAGTPASAAAPGVVKTRFAVIYRPVAVDDESQLSEPWWLVLYVDGRCVASVKPGSALLPFPPRTFDHELAPGKHLLRITQERPLHRRTGHGYTSLSRIDPSELVFALEPGVDAQVHVRFGEKSFRHPGPIAVRIEQQGRATARLEPPAPDPEAWPPLCEDIPAALPPGAKLPSAARKQLAKCVQWAALWPGMTTVPPRDEVRGEAARLASAPPAVP